MKMGALMTTEIEVVAPGETLANVLDLMQSRRLSCLPVVEDGRPVGVISERDVVSVLTGHLHGERLPATAAHLMSAPPITILGSASIETAVRLQQDRGIRRLLVVDDAGRLIGLVTQSDLVEAQTLALEHERDRLEEHVSERTEALRLANQRLEQLALVDPMLGTGNRRAMDRELARLQGLANRFGRGFALVMFDIDEFKKFNDRYGHPEADLAMGSLVKATQGTIRRSDSLYRFGGEEFVVTLPEANGDGALAEAERIRAVVEALQIPHELSVHRILTVSLGVSVALPGAGLADVTGMIRAADASLYQAKEHGRNRTGNLMFPEVAGSG